MVDDVAVHRIGEAARQSGVSPANIRYYEKEGLLPPGARGDNSYRLYSAADVHRLRFVRLCRAMDMSLDEVRTLLALDLTRKEDCHAACDTLDEHLQHVRARLARACSELSHSGKIQAPWKTANLTHPMSATKNGRSSHRT